MEKQIYNRWLEISYYYFCLDIIAINEDLQDIYTTIENFAYLGKYPIIALQALTQKILSTYYIQPTKEELILLCYKNKMPTRQIIKLLKINGKRLYSVLEDDKQNPRAFYPRLEPEETLIVEQFLKTVHKIKKAGLQYDRFR